MKITKNQRDAATAYWAQVLHGDVDICQKSTDLSSRKIIRKNLTRNNPQWTSQFMSSLEEVLCEAMEKDEPLTLNVDYHPKGLLAEAAKRAGIPEDLFPSVKLTLSFDNQDNIIVNDEKINAEQFFIQEEIKMKAFYEKFNEELPAENKDKTRTKVSVVGLDMTDVLLYLYNNATGRGEAFAKADDMRAPVTNFESRRKCREISTVIKEIAGPGDRKIAEKRIKDAIKDNRFYFDYVDLGAGPRSIKVNLGLSEIDVTSYDHEHGKPGYAAAIIEQAKKDVLKEYKWKKSVSNLLKDFLSINPLAAAELNVTSELGDGRMAADAIASQSTYPCIRNKSKQHATPNIVSDLTNITSEEELLYIIDEKNRLRIASKESLTRDNSGQKIELSHRDLAKGKPVLGAGMIKVREGKIVSIDNQTTDYDIDMTPHLKNKTEQVFQQHGFEEAANKFVSKGRVKSSFSTPSQQTVSESHCDVGMLSEGNESYLPCLPVEPLPKEAPLPSSFLKPVNFDALTANFNNILSKGVSVKPAASNRSQFFQPHDASILPTNVSSSFNVSGYAGHPVSTPQNGASGGGSKGNHSSYGSGGSEGAGNYRLYIDGGKTGGRWGYKDTNTGHITYTGGTTCPTK